MNTSSFVLTNKARVKRVYSGRRRGCMCGCLGKYSDSPKQITRIVNILNNLDKHDPGTYDRDPEPSVEYVYVEVNGHVYGAYFGTHA